MYIYIVQRTQIYLSAKEKRALDALARRTGRTRSKLIRDAIGAMYLQRASVADIEQALNATAGAWRRHRQPNGAAWVERMRSGRLARQHGG
jgi:predicted DNA-binding protein